MVLWFKRDEDSAFVKHRSERSFARRYVPLRRGSLFSHTHTQQVKWLTSFSPGRNGPFRSTFNDECQDFLPDRHR